MKIGLILFPRLTQLDLTGPAEVFGRIPGAEVLLLWKDKAPVASDRGIRFLPTTAFDECDHLDIVCVPGGPGQLPLMDDQETLDFLRRIAPSCKLVTSVCTGSLVLGAAGLLRGYRATCHWSSIDQLALLGAEPVHERVVRDRNRITGAGVTSGIDFALNVVADLLGPAAAQEIQLQLEYDPEPPFRSGSPRTADPAILAGLRGRLEPLLVQRREAAQRAAERLEAAGRE